VPLPLLLVFGALRAFSVHHKLLAVDNETVGDFDARQLVVGEAEHFAARMTEEVRMIAGASFRKRLVGAKPPRAVGSLHLMGDFFRDKARKGTVQCNSVEGRERVLNFRMGKRASGLHEESQYVHAIDRHPQASRSQESGGVFLEFRVCVHLS
jgi:hypothetical protein